MGGKRTKLPPPPPSSKRKAKPADPLDPLDRVEAHLTRTLEIVEAAMDRGEATPAVVRESANCARALINVSAERRARVKLDRIRVESLTERDVMRWLRDTDDNTRRQVAKELSELLSGEARWRSVLA
jgi:hypothetical protein